MVPGELALNGPCTPWSLDSQETQARSQRLPKKYHSLSSAHKSTTKPRLKRSTRPSSPKPQTRKRPSGRLRWESAKLGLVVKARRTWDRPHGEGPREAACVGPKTGHWALTRATMRHRYAWGCCTFNFSYHYVSKRHFFGFFFRIRKRIFYFRRPPRARIVALVAEAETYVTETRPPGVTCTLLPTT
jgi:hypothetical protein